MGMEFPVHGAREFEEPGVFVAFEETTVDLIKNTHSLGFDLRSLVEKKKIGLDHICIEKAELEETGEFDLDGRSGNGPLWNFVTRCHGSGRRTGRRPKKEQKND